jgi:hypothetical protein
MKAYAPKKRAGWLNCKVFEKKILPCKGGDFFFKTLHDLARALAAYLGIRFYL